MAGRVLAVVLGLGLASHATAHPPWGIAVDDRGQVYFSDLETIWKVDAQGGLQPVRAGVPGRHTHALHLDGSGVLHGEDLVYEPGRQRFLSALWQMDIAGRVRVLVPMTDDPPEGASPLRDVSGASYHVSRTASGGVLVFRRDARGRSQQVHGDPVQGARFRQGVMDAKQALGPDGSLYFTIEASLGRWSAKDGLRMLLDRLPLEPGRRSHGGASGESLLFGLDVDAKGQVYAADWGNRRIIRVGSDGRITSMHRSTDPWQPAGVAEKDGALYILEHRYTAEHRYAGSRVVLRTSEGRASVLTTRRVASP